MRIIDADRLNREIKDKFGYYSATAFVRNMQDLSQVEVFKHIMRLIEEAPTIEERQAVEWIPINEKTMETLQDRYYYLVAHKDYTTPLKAKFYKELPPYFKVCTFNGNFVTYIFEEEDNEITHVMKLPELPKEEIFCPNCGERLEVEE